MTLDSLYLSDGRLCNSSENRVNNINMLEVYHETLGNLQIVIDSDDWSQFKIAAGTPLIGYTKPFYEPRSPGPTTNEIFEGHVSFGTPVVTTAKEEGMIIPRSLMQRGDVYIVRFAVSFSKINLKIIEQLSFSVTGTANMIALELIPFKFDKETSITKTVSSPDIKIKYGDNAVELGEFYKKQVVYKVLKPTIVANGLQESTFAWYMTDEAIHQGANQFMAILLVPKKEKALTVNLEAGAKTKPTWIAQGNAIATPSLPVKIELKQGSVPPGCAQGAFLSSPYGCLLK